MRFDLRTRRFRRWRPARTVGLVVALAGLGIGVAVAQQIQIQVQVRGGGRAVPPVADEPRLSGGPTIETNADADSLLGRARQYLADAEYRDALMLLQHLADHYGGALTSPDGRLYQPTRRTVEDLLLNLPAEALRLYRLEADGEARGLLGDDPMRVRDERKLRQVVERYFASSVGDDAAYALGCRLLDRGEPRQAARLFQRLVDLPIETSVDLDAVRLRLAAARLLAGETADAAAALLADLASPGVDPQARRAVEAMVHAAQEDRGPGRQPNASDGASPAGDAGEESIWAIRWQARLALSQVAAQPRDNNPHRRASRQSRAELIDRWRQHGWMPTGDAVIESDRAFIKLGRVVLAIDTESGRLLWRQASAEQTPPFSYSSQGNTPYPTSTDEMMLFGERVGRKIARIGETVYHIDGEWPIGVLHRRVSRRRNAFDNELVALNAATGQVRWRCEVAPSAGAGGGRPGGENARFVSTPVDAGDRLLALVEDESQLRLVAIDPADGAVRWSRFLSSATPGFAPPWAPADLAVEDGAVFIAAGNGLIFAAEAADGQLRWVRRYERQSPDADATRRWTHGQWSAEAQAWLENRVLLAEGRLVVAAADSPTIRVLDPQRGRLRATITDNPEPPASEVNHVVGVAGGRLFLAGPSAAAAYEVDTGRLAWRSYLPDASGRATLAAGSMFAPLDQDVVRIDLVTGKWQRRSSVSRMIRDPIGNLYSDGRRLLSLGMERVTGLADARLALRRLAEEAVAGDVVALVERADLHEQLGDAGAAATDLRRALRRSDDPQQREPIRRRLLTMLLERARQSEVDTAALLAEAGSLAVEPAERMRVLLAEADWKRGRGEPIEAAKRYFEIAFSGEHTLVAIDADGTRRVAVTALAQRRLDELAIEHAEVVSNVLEPQARRELRRLTADGFDGPLLAEAERLIRAAPRTPTVGGAIDRLVDGLVERRISPASTERLLRELGRSDHGPTAARALAGLVRHYADRGWDRDAAEVAHHLADRWPEAALPDEEAGSVPAHRWAEARLAELERDAAPPPTQLDRPPYVQAFDVSMHRGERLFTFLHEPTPAESQFLQSHFLTYRPPPQGLIICRDGRTGRGRGIKLPDPLTDANYIQRRGSEHRFVGGMDGHLLVLRNSAMAAVYDVVEQREVARIETDSAPPLLTNRSGLSNAFHVGGGVIVEHLLDDEALNHLVRTYDLADGRLLWERRIESSGFQGVWATDDAVLLVAQNGQRLDLVDRRTGRRLRRVELAGYLPNHQMAFSPHGLLYRTITGVAYQPLDAEREPWRLDGGFEDADRDGEYRGRWAPSRFGVLSEDRGYVYWNRGNDRALSLIDLNRGREIWRQNREQIGRSVFDVALGSDGRRLAVYGFDREVQMVLLDARTGEVQAQADLGRNLEQRVDVRTLARAGSILPLVERDPGNRSKFDIRFYRASDGRELDVALPADGQDGPLESIAQSPIVRAGTLIVPTERGIFGFARDPESRSDVLPLRPTPGPDEARRAEPEPHRADAAGAGIRLQMRQGRMIIIGPDGRRRDIGPRGQGRLEIRQVDGKVEIRRDGKLVPTDEAPADPDPDANPNRPADEQAEPADGE